MKSAEIVANIEATLERLIQNSRMLNEISSEDEAAALQKMQDALLDHLLRMDNLLDDEEKQLVLQSDPSLYGNLDEKVRRLSALNLSALRPRPNRWIEKARVHRNKSFIN